LASGDPNWPALRALDFHYHTQPLPNVISWYADKLPRWAQSASTFGVLAIELGAGFLIFAPRRWRLTGAWGMLSLQALIFATGNYTFFNFLAVALVVYAFDDQALRRFDVERIPASDEGVRPTGRAAPIARSAFAIWIGTLGFLRIAESASGIL